MCYDISWDEPGPIRSREAFARDLAFAKSRIPADKLVMAVPWYGRDWNITDKTHEDILWRMTDARDGIMGMDEIVGKFGGKPVWREPEGELSYTYTVGGKLHEVWMADPRQFEWMVDEVRKAGVRGVYIWQLEYASPEFIPVVRRKVKR
jgi:spore germination protein YaaH